MDAVLLFDGDCEFCRRSVDWLRRLPRGSRVLCLPRNSPDAAAILQGRRLPDSLLLRDEGGWHEGAEAVLRAARHAGLHPLVLFLAHRVPRSIRERAYRAIARNRHRLCRSGSCILAKPDH